MNPIEHLWYLLKTRINNREKIPKTVAELKEALLEEWEKMELYIINSLIDSMPNHVQCLLESKGGPTRY